MSKLQVLRTLVSERLTAAAEEILKITEKKKLQAAEMSPDQQRAVVHKRLLAVADEIFRILEAMMGEYEAEVSGSREEIGRRRQLLDVTLKTETSSHRTDRRQLSGSDSDQLQKTSNPPQIKDASTETDGELIHGKTSHPHPTQRAERGTSTATGPEAGGKRELLSSKSEAGSEDEESDEGLNEKSPRLKKRKKFQHADCCRTCGASLKGKKTKKDVSKTFPAGRLQTGRSRCRVCGKFFRYKRSFLKHVLQHAQTSDLCGACGRRLDPGESLKEHLRTHAEENVCGERADGGRSDDESDEEWMDSEWTDSDDGDSEREQKPPSAKNQANKPKAAKNRDCKDASHLKYSCKVCSKSFCYRASFLKHVQEDEQDAELCGVCGKRFESEELLRLHLQTYVRTNDCEVCGKQFDGHKQLEMHMRTHTGEKPYVCTVCGKAYAQNGNLMGHMRVHTGQRPYVCSVCGQSFSFKEYMTAHMRIHTGEKPFLCSFCGKGFRQRGTLKTHTMIHTGESTHRCLVCDKKFYKSSALKIHMRSHTGEKPFLCNVCGKSFATGGSLTKHMGAHEGERAEHGCGVRGKAPRRHGQSRGDEDTQLTSL